MSPVYAAEQLSSNIVKVNGGEAGSISASSDSAGNMASDSGTALSSEQKVSEEPGITQDEAVAKVRKLFPSFEQADADQVRLEQNDRYGQDRNVWEIHWTIQRANSSYGFSSTVDAVNGDILSVHHFSSFDQPAEGTYYGSAITKEEAL